MSDDLELSVDWNAVDTEARKLVRRYTEAGVTAVAAVTKRLERRLEAATQAGAPGRLWRAWASETYENDGTDPAGIVFVKGGDRSRGAMTFWSQPGAIRSANGQFLAVPLPAAGSRGRGRTLTPGEWERDHPGVRLQFVYRPGRPSLLVAVGAMNARSGTFRTMTGKRAEQGRFSVSVPIFVLLPLVNFRNTIAIEPIVAQTAGELRGEFMSTVGSA